jgi:hypothetical protein
MAKQARRHVRRAGRRLRTAIAAHGDQQDLLTKCNGLRINNEDANQVEAIRR